MTTLRYPRVLLKLSGEALRGQESSGFDPDVLDYMVQQIQPLHELGVQLGLVVGGGNFYRGAKAQMTWLRRQVADSVGMLATMMNALVMQELLSSHGMPCSLFSAAGVEGVVPKYRYRDMVDAFAQGHIVIFGGGTGHPFFTTDTTAALRAREMDADLLIKATQVDGVYDADPHVHPDAKRFASLSYLEVLQRDLRVMDATGISFCREYEIPILVTNISEPDQLRRAVLGEDVGTLIHANDGPKRES